MVSPLLSITIGIVALLVGKKINQAIPTFDRLSIPAPVTGGLLFACLALVLHLLWSVTLEFDLNARDFLLVYFFTIVGINSRLSGLRRGGKDFVLLIALLAFFMAAQNLIGVAMAKLMGLKAAVGLLLGTVSLVGGHGVTIAWSPSFVDEFEIANAMEIGLAASTIGLILASLSGGPVASYLVRKHAAVFAFTVGAIVGFFSRAPLTSLFGADASDQPSISYQSLCLLHSRSMSASLPGS